MLTAELSCNREVGSGRIVVCGEGGGGHGELAASGWSDPDTARSWTSGDRLAPLLDLPRAMVGALAALGGDRPLTVMDVGSGPGDFLERVLDLMPRAKGVWTDLSSAMATEARERLARFGTRIDYHVVPLDRLEEVVEPSSVDLLISSRVTHHLEADQLMSFYRSAYRLLAPDGWLANLDHVSITGIWPSLLRPVRDRMFPPNPSAHPHPRPAPSLDEHLAAAVAAGLTDTAVLWSAFWTALVAARKAGTDARPDAPRRTL